ncbi:NAD-dependent epimerase/dehydratase family protein [Sinomonas sp. B1-1]|uniref:NAD-dependent epimerase/dehydratase family protein n=1 Tax=Sinomonas sp. B1-1 TaxID=3141454 RepID=UPI003D289AA7
MAPRSALAGCDAVVHLAWVIQPNHREEELRRVNVDGSARVFDAAAQAGVKHLAYASSVGAYSPGPKDRRVDESWPTGGLHTSHYSRQKADVERILDRFEADHPEIAVARLRSGLTFQSGQASSSGGSSSGGSSPSRWPGRGCPSCSTRRRCLPRADRARLAAAAELPGSSVGRPRGHAAGVRGPGIRGAASRRPGRHELSPGEQAAGAQTNFAMRALTCAT